MTSRGRVVSTLIGAALFVAPVEAQQTHVLVLTGLSGDPAYAEQFHTWATTLIDAATERYELPSEQVIYLGEKTAIDPERDRRPLHSRERGAGISRHRRSSAAE